MVSLYLAVLLRSMESNVNQIMIYNIAIYNNSYFFDDTFEIVIPSNTFRNNFGQQNITY
jgi:hypothetical protein